MPTPEAKARLQLATDLVLDLLNADKPKRATVDVRCEDYRIEIRVKLHRYEKFSLTEGQHYSLRSQLDWLLRARLAHEHMHKGDALMHFVTTWPAVEHVCRHPSSSRFAVQKTVCLYSTVLFVLFSLFYEGLRRGRALVVAPTPPPPRYFYRRFVLHAPLVRRSFEAPHWSAPRRRARPSLHDLVHAPGFVAPSCPLGDIGASLSHRHLFAARPHAPAPRHAGRDGLDDSHGNLAFARLHSVSRSLLRGQR